MIHRFALLYAASRCNLEVLSINIQGTPEEPLFQANQIGALPGLVNIRVAPVSQIPWNARQGLYSRLSPIDRFLNNFFFEVGGCAE